MQTKVYRWFFYAIWKENTHKPSKVEAAKNVFSRLYVTGASCFDECFFTLRDGWKVLFFIKVNCWYSAFFQPLCCCCLSNKCFERSSYFRLSSQVNNNNNLKSDSHLPKSFLLFASMIALQKWWKMFFISS